MRHKIYTLYKKNSMKNNNAEPYNENRSTESNERRNSEAGATLDLQDSPHDAERLKPDEATIDLPDVKDIPGQEFVQVPPLGMLADTTISSADEEGEGLFDDDEEDDTEISMGTEGDVTKEEKEALEKGDNFGTTEDDTRLQRASMDSTDLEGEPLNEGSFGDERSGMDLDIPEAADETNTDALGQGDEENKHYSLDDNDDDHTTE